MASTLKPSRSFDSFPLFSSQWSLRIRFLLSISSIIFSSCPFPLFPFPCLLVPYLPFLTLPHFLCMVVPCSPFPFPLSLPFYYLFPFSYHLHYLSVSSLFRSAVSSFASPFLPFIRSSLTCSSIFLRSADLFLSHSFIPLRYSTSPFWFVILHPPQPLSLFSLPPHTPFFSHPCPFLPSLSPPVMGHQYSCHSLPPFTLPPPSLVFLPYPSFVLASNNPLFLSAELMDNKAA